MRSLEENGKVERGHRTDQEEFYGVNRLVSIGHCVQLLKNWKKEYNEDGPHMALDWKTPKEYLLENHVSSQALISPIKTVQRVD